MRKFASNMTFTPSHVSKAPAAAACKQPRQGRGRSRSRRHRSRARWRAGPLFPERASLRGPCARSLEAAAPHSHTYAHAAPHAHPSITPARQYYRGSQPTAPFGSASMSYVSVQSGWVSAWPMDVAYMSDLALVVLDGNLGAVAGTMGFEYNPAGYSGRLMVRVCARARMSEGVGRGPGQRAGGAGGRPRGAGGGAPLRAERARAAPGLPASPRFRGRGAGGPLQRRGAAPRGARAALTAGRLLRAQAAGYPGQTVVNGRYYRLAGDCEVADTDGTDGRLLFQVCGRM